MRNTSHISSLYEWLERNNIRYEKVDDDVVNIPDFGKCFYMDTEHSSYKSIFRKNEMGEMEFNCLHQPSELLADGLKYTVFKFGDCYYYTDNELPFQMNILRRVGRHTHEPGGYCNLGVHTPYELLNGSMPISEWVKAAKFMGHEYLGVCDFNTMGALFNLQKECEAAGIKPVFGYTMEVMWNDAHFFIKLYALNMTGWKNLLRVQKAVAVEHGFEVFPVDYLAHWNRGEGLALVLSDNSHKVADDANLIRLLKKSFDVVFWQLDTSEYKAERIDIEVLERLKFWKRYWMEHTLFETDLDPVLISDCYYISPDEAQNKIVLNKVATGAAHRQSDDQYYKTLQEQREHLVPLFENEGLAELLLETARKNTMLIAQTADVHIDTTRNYMPKYDMTEEEAEKYGTTHNMFLSLLEDGFKRLVPKGREEEYRKRLDFEVYNIESTDNVDYLLIQYDTVNWARRNGILVGCGRGSAAGCLALYLLGITLIDPIKYRLFFERFLLPERAGVYPATTTIIGQDVDSEDYYEVTMENGRTIRFDKDAVFRVKRGDKEYDLFADQLREGDDIIFDNKDLLFTINEL